MIGVCSAFRTKYLCLTGVFQPWDYVPHHRWNTIRVLRHVLLYFLRPIIFISSRFTLKYNIYNIYILYIYSS